MPMKTKDIKHILKQQLQVIDKCTAAIGDDGFKEEDIHDLRVPVKALHAMLRLLASYNIDIKPGIPHKLKRLYGIAGIIREAQLEMSMLEKKDLALPGYTEQLDNTIIQQKKEWHKAYSHKTVHKAWKQIADYSYDAPNAEALRHFYTAHLATLTTLQDTATDTDIHNVRKRVKDIVLLVRYLPGDLRQAAQYPGDGAIKKLQELARITGDYNDQRLLLEHLETYLQQTPTATDKTIVQQLTATTRQQLQADKKRVVGMVREQLPGI